MAKQQPLIAIVDDEPAVLRSIARLLQLQGFAVKPYSSAQRLLEEIERCSPGCIVSDLSMPELSGLELQRTLAKYSEQYPIVFITGHGDIRSSVEAMRAGAVDFLTKPFEQSELLDAVERALLRSRQAREVGDKLDGMRHRVESLTQREREVFEQVVAGYLNKQIAAHLGISEKTVKVHRARVMRKMSVKSVAQLARLAEQIGIPPP
jgi:FixJ family two-component response regulator